MIMSSKSSPSNIKSSLVMRQSDLQRQVVDMAAAARMRSPDPTKIRNTRAPGPHGGAQALARTVENWWGEVAMRLGACSLAPSMGERRSTGRGDQCARAYQLARLLNCAARASKDRCQA